MKGQSIYYRSILLLSLLVVASSSCNPSGVVAGGSPSGSNGQTVISVSGAFALFPMMTVWTEEYEKVNPLVRFDVQAGGAGKGMTDMLSGAADIAMLSREARSEELNQGSFLVPVTIDAVVATINAENPYAVDIMRHGLSPDFGSGIWIRGDINTWGDWLGNGAAETMNVYTRSDACGASEMWVRYLGGQAQEELLGTAVNGDPGLAEAVRQDALGIGYNNIGFAYDQQSKTPINGLLVVPLDLNGDGEISTEEDFYDNRDDLIAAIGQEVYPFPPARVLYLVTKGKPSPAIIDFYRWVLTDGQAFVPQAGYVKLTDAHIEEALKMLED